MADTTLACTTGAAVLRQVQASVRGLLRLAGRGPGRARRCVAQRTSPRTRQRGSRHRPDQHDHERDHDRSLALVPSDDRPEARAIRTHRASGCHDTRLARAAPAHSAAAGDPAVERDHRAGQVRPGPRGEEHGQPGGVVGPPDPAEGNYPRALRRLSGVSSMNAIILLSNGPGAIALTVICSEARRRARCRVSMCTAALLAL